jgi:nitric oxide reductase subunit B
MKTKMGRVCRGHHPVVRGARLGRRPHLPDGAPIPAEVTTTAGDLVRGATTIEAGQNVWQSMGGMEQGSIWGHGSYVAPDWTADWLHRESVAMLDIWGAQEFGRSYDQLPPINKRSLRQRLVVESRTNTYDSAE